MSNLEKDDGLPFQVETKYLIRLKSTGRFCELPEFKSPLIEQVFVICIEVAQTVTVILLCVPKPYTFTKFGEIHIKSIRIIQFSVVKSTLYSLMSIH